jgi:hypothetical protein
MFGISLGINPRSYENPQRYQGGFRPPSPNHLARTAPSHAQHSHAQTSFTAGPTQTPYNAATSPRDGGVVPIRQREVVLPTHNRAPRHPPSTALHRSLPSQPSPSRSGQAGVVMTGASPGVPAVPITRGPPADGTAADNFPRARPHQRHQGHHHNTHRHNQRARSSGVRRSGEEPQRRNGGDGNGGNTSESANRLSDMLNVGWRGFQTYMGVMFQSYNRGGLNLHPTPYDAGTSNSTYRVPESSPLEGSLQDGGEPALHRTSSEIVTGPERSRRVEAQLTGIPIDEQHRLLRRLKFTSLAFAQETESTLSGPASVCNSTASPLSTLTPLSAFMLPNREGGFGTLESWVVSLDAANPWRIPYPAVSQSCSVCLRRFQDGEDVAELPCGHFYHFTCIIRWLKLQGSCPCCRADVRRWKAPNEREMEEPPGG